MKTIKFVAIIDGREVMETNAYPLDETIKDEFLDISNNLSSRLMESGLCDDE